jgi:hypothetical protein
MILPILNRPALYRALFSAEHVGPVVVKALSRTEFESQSVYRLGLFALKAVALAYHSSKEVSYYYEEDQARIAASEERLWHKVSPILTEQLTVDTMAASHSTVVSVK